MGRLYGKGNFRLVMRKKKYCVRGNLTRVVMFIKAIRKRNTLNTSLWGHHFGLGGERMTESSLIEKTQ